MDDLETGKPPLRLVPEQKKQTDATVAAGNFGMVFSMPPFDPVVMDALDCTPVDVSKTFDATDNVVPLKVKQKDPRTVSAEDTTPLACLQLALADTAANPKITKCYITMFEEGEDDMVSICYRAGLTMAEEVAYRTLGASGALDNWKSGGK